MFRTILCVASLLLVACDSEKNEQAKPEAADAKPKTEEATEQPEAAPSPGIAVVGQTLPQVTAALPDPAGLTKVYVTPEEIRFNAQRVASIDGGTIDPAAVKGHLIGSLFDALSEEVDKSKAVAAQAGGEWNSTLVIVADAATPFTTLVDVLYTGGRAKFEVYEFVAVTPDGSAGAVPVKPPRFGPEGVSGGPPLKAMVMPDGLRVTIAGDAEVVPNLAGKTGTDALDLAALTTRAKAHREVSTRSVVSAGSDIPYAQLVAVMATLYGDGCADAPAKCLLPDLSIEAGAG